ncbi:hypothetical protein BV134_1019 [Haemophilus influenzae]|nr:hypothetical protein BV134_1019 [Haemophilus influenzae]EDK08529.1 hypothetical protein CGSHiAA_08610 [Haemophilus influenzae PittAA]
MVFFDVIIWELFGNYLGIIWELFGNYLGIIWELFGKLENLLIFNSRLISFYLSSVK